MTRPVRRSGSQRQSKGRRTGSRAAAEQTLVDVAADLGGETVLVPLVFGTAVAGALLARMPSTQFVFWTPEHFFLQSLEELVRNSTTSTEEDSAPDDGGLQHASIVCAADPPVQEFQTVVFPTSATGAAELTQELLQTSHQRLAPGGRLIVSTDNPSDHWLHDQLKSLFGRVTAHRHPDAAVYAVRKQGELKKVREFRATTKFRFGERLLTVVTRPGVFSHRAVDGGARALIRSLAADPPPCTGSSPEEQSVRRIVELGCGSGAAAMAAAVADPFAEVLAIDSHARAVECTEAGASANQMTNLRVLLASDAAIPGPGTWDLLLTNPPYFSDFRISELFLRGAKRALKRGGQIRLVTRLTDWHVARMQQLFNQVVVRRFGEYDVITALRQ